MTLIWQLTVGLGAVLIISGLEGLSITCTVQWVWSGAPAGFPTGCSSATAAPQTSGSSSNLKSITTGG